MKSKNLEKYGLKLSVFGTLFMAIFGISFGLWIQSEAILLDGFFNFISLIMAIASLWVSWLITQPTSNLFQFDYLNFIPFINLIKGLLISFVSLFALASSIITILEGGRTMNAGLAVIYAMIAAGGCLIIAIIQRKIAQKTNSSMVIVDAQNWLVNGLISFSVGIAFSIVVLIKGSPWEWFIPYSDSTIVIVMVLISLDVPIKIVIDNLKQLLLAAPNPKIEKELKNILTTVIQDLPCDQYTVRMTQTGQYLYLYIVWLLPQQDKNSTVKQIDEYRNIVTNALQQFNSDITIDIIFTEDQSWFKKRNKLKYLFQCMALTIEDYEKKEWTLEKPTAIEVLKYLMTEHGLNECDLPEIGDQKLVSDLLTGKRELNLTTIKILAKRFGVSTKTFLIE